MVLYLSLTISVVLFGLTSADPTAQELLRNHNSICDNGQVAGLIAECIERGDPCWKQDPSFYDANQIKCYTPLQRTSFRSEAGRPRTCSNDKAVVAYGDDFACIAHDDRNVVGCDRPLYCIWAKAEDIDKWAHSPRKTTYIENDYPVEVVGGDWPCKHNSQVPRFETGVCNYSHYTSSCDYDYTCERRNKNAFVSVLTVKNSPPPGMKCDPGMVPTEVDTCSGLNRDPSTCREWKCLDGSTFPKAWSGSDRTDHSRKNKTGISYRM